MILITTTFIELDLKKKKMNFNKYQQLYSLQFRSFSSRMQVYRARKRKGKVTSG